MCICSNQQIFNRNVSFNTASKDFSGVITQLEGTFQALAAFPFIFLGACVFAHTHPLVAVPGIAPCFDAL